MKPAPHLFAKIDFGSSMYFFDPVRVIMARTVEEVVPALETVQKAVDEGLWAVGFLSYEAAPAFDPAFRVHTGTAPDGGCASSTATDLPLLCFGLFSGPGSEPQTAPRSFDVSDWTPSLSTDEHA